MVFLIFILIPIFLGIWAQSRVTQSYNYWTQFASQKGLTGRSVAIAIMRKSGIDDVYIEEVSGHLSDHYNPKTKTLALSSKNYHGTSIAAIGVAAHEAGHAIQHKRGYFPLLIRSSLITATQVCSRALPFIAFGGILVPALGMRLIPLAALVYIVLTLFQLITLPVEFNASRRAKDNLLALGILDADEMPGVHQVLDAAALTYVAAFVSSFGWFLYFIGLGRSR